MSGPRDSTSFIEVEQARDMEDTEKKLLVKRVLRHVSGQPLVRTNARNYHVMNLALGIYFNVSKLECMPNTELTPFEFNESVKIDLPKLSPDQSEFYQFKDYCPHVFKALRDRMGVDSDSYIASLCNDSTLFETATPGKSGSTFYYSHDGSYVIKTITKAESKIIRKFLPHYYRHVMLYPHTLLSRFYGLHRVRGGIGTTHFIVMANVFDCPNWIHEKYDLKGSTYGRRSRDEDIGDPTKTLKDINFIEMRGERSLVLGPLKRQIFLEQLRADAFFLADHGIMDYSLLIGIHYRDRPSPEVDRSIWDRRRQVSLTKKYIAQGLNAPAMKGPKGHLITMFQMEDGGFSSVGNAREEMMDPMDSNYMHIMTSDDDMDERDSLQDNPIVMIDETPSDLVTDEELEESYSSAAFLPRNSDLRRKEFCFEAPSVELTNRELVKSTITSALPDIETQESLQYNPLYKFKQKLLRQRTFSNLKEEDQRFISGNEVYYFGIIDITTEWSAKKSLEHGFKSIITNGNAISAVNPKDYALRFLEFFEDHTR
ncbi:hypothetical protein PCE1_001226 [Barthelona sp. PCE]